MNLKGLPRAVERGAKLLDDKRPGWPDELTDLHLLDVSCGSRCPLGLLYGSYEDGLDALDLAYWSDDPGVYGFNAPDGTEFIRACRALSDLWRAVITRKQTAVPATRLAE